MRRSELHSACPRCNSQTWYAHATAIAANLSTLPFFELEEAWLRYKLAAALLAKRPLLAVVARYLTSAALIVFCLISPVRP